MTPATASVNTFIGTPTTVNSTALGAYSLNGGLMIGEITPSSVGTSSTNPLSFMLQNTTTGSDPFPDYVDMAVVQIPNQSYVSVPTTCSGITVNTTGWSCLAATGGSGLPTIYYLGQCSQQATTLPTVPATSTSLGSDNLTVCPFSRPNEPYSLSPGSLLNFSVPVTAGSTATGTPVTVPTWAHGVTTDAWTSPITSSLSVVATATARVGFSSINSAVVATGSQPQVISNNPATTGNTYVYKIRNTGSVAITSASITIPGPDITGTNGQDSSGQAWQVTPVGSPTTTLLVEGQRGPDGCTSAVTNPSPANGTNTGTIAITCPAGALIAGRTLDITFTAVAPLKINSQYLWPATINGGTATAPNWFNDNQILIAVSASLGVTVNNVACTIKGGSGNTAADDHARYLHDEFRDRQRQYVHVLSRRDDRDRDHRLERAVALGALRLRQLEPRRDRGRAQLGRLDDQRTQHPNRHGQLDVDQRDVSFGRQRVLGLRHDGVRPVPNDVVRKRDANRLHDQRRLEDSHERRFDRPQRRDRGGNGDHSDDRIFRDVDLHVDRELIASRLR